jgi:hypothetical protein
MQAGFKSCLGIVAGLVFSVALADESVKKTRSVAVFSLKENRGAFVIGDLGGVPVKIPRDFARFVEYDNDPHFMEKRRGAPPKRTYRSRLRSFGFEVRYPDMISIKNETGKEKKHRNIYNSMWLSVGLSSGEYNYRTPHLDAYLEQYSNTNYIFQKLDNPIYGLETYIPIRAKFPWERRHQNAEEYPIEKFRSKIGYELHDQNLYFFRDPDGHAVTFIACSNALIESATCRQRFLMKSPIRAAVDFSYRRALLPHWQDMQSKITSLIIGFKVIKPDASLFLSTSSSL